MVSYIKIKPIRIGNLQEKIANAISWYVPQIHRNAESGYVVCSLLNVIDQNNSIHISTFEVEIDNTTLQSWGADDSVIDNLVLSYSPLFEIE